MSKYDKLTPKQKEFFDLYIRYRSINPIVTQTGYFEKEVRRLYSSKGVQEALLEHNENLKETTYYNEAVIIDKLWCEYMDEKTPKNVKINVLVLLGKHIGMWANASRQKENKTNRSINYNVINYNNMKEEIEANKEAVEKAEKDMDLDIPKGITITEYSGNA